MPNLRTARELHLVDLFADFTVGAAGAPTLKQNVSLGIKSIVRNSTGNYTVNFISSFVRCVMVNEALVSTAPAAPIMSVASVANANGSVTPLSPSITIQFQNSAGAATDPANGEEILLNLIMSKSTGA
jgi:hypothetical protein